MYPSAISENVLLYLRKNKLIQETEILELVQKSNQLKKTALTIFVEDHPEFSEKIDQIIAYLDEPHPPLPSENSQKRIQILNEENSADANGFVYKMLKKSISYAASDIHLDMALTEDLKKAFKLRYRVDGKCFDEGLYTELSLYRGIVNKLKLDAGLKIDERRLPQDGRLSFEWEGVIYNFRLSFIPTTIRNAQEEKIVLRQMADVDSCHLNQLDILPYDLKMLQEAIQFPHGFICITGPTGSGKTTTLYALLQEINRQEKNCMTLEDPIEAEIPLVNQSQMFHRIGYDFAAGLRVILRQDPDVIMVGEMRDEETASKAFEAANTGHLVFSTLHTNTAASTITRLLQMKVPHYFISSALKYVVSQRLVRRLCHDCRRPDPDQQEILKMIELSFSASPPHIQTLYAERRKDAEIFTTPLNPLTCLTCRGTGYRGRVGIMEVMKIEDEIRHIINFEQGNEDLIQKSAEKNGLLTLRQYGYLQVLKGLTTFEEINTTVMNS